MCEYNLKYVVQYVEVTQISCLLLQASIDGTFHFLFTDAKTVMLE